MSTVGEMLKKEREARNISLEEISKETKISMEFLRAIENDEFFNIPGEIFVVGFIRNYAKYIGINEDDAVNLYKAQKIEEELKLDKIYQFGFKKKFSAKKILLFIFLLFFIIIGVVFVINSINSEKKEKVADINNNIVNESYPTASTYPVENTGETVYPAEVSNETVEEKKSDHLTVILKAEGNSDKIWLGYCSDQLCKESHSQWKSIFLKANRYVKVEGNEIVGVIAGNAGYLRAIVNGKDIGFIGKPGQVKTKIFRKSDYNE